ncbi:MAG: 50S ribosomal protein L23 [Bdellovibrionaceae bacterium]|nr:50S ribosomal protein L23 [Pseudobdellovibrionaceae bacterium]
MKNLELYPLITEKSAKYSDYSTYVFRASADYDKTMIKDFLEKRFSIKVKGIRTAIFSRKATNKRTNKVKSSYFKKVFVKVDSGVKIPLFEGV